MSRDPLFVEEALRAIDRIMTICQASADEIAADRDQHDALLWNVTVLGESCARVSEAVKSAHPGVPWRDATDFRNRIVHGYWTVDLDIVVAVARTRMPELAIQLRELLESLDA